MKKDSCTPINPKKYSCYGLKKIHTRNLSSFDNETKFLRLENSPPPPPRPRSFLMVRPLREPCFEKRSALIIITELIAPYQIRKIRKIRIPKSWKFLLVESEMRENFPVVSGILGFGIWNMALGIRNPTND